MSEKVVFEAWALELNGSPIIRGGYDLYDKRKVFMDGDCRRPVRVRVTVEPIEEDAAK